MQEQHASKQWPLEYWCWVTEWLYDVNSATSLEGALMGKSQICLWWDRSSCSFHLTVSAVYIPTCREVICQTIYLNTYMESQAWHIRVSIRVDKEDMYKSNTHTPLIWLETLDPQINGKFIFSASKWCNCRAWVVILSKVDIGLNSVMPVEMVNILIDVGTRIFSIFDYNIDRKLFCFLYLDSKYLV